MINTDPTFNSAAALVAEHIEMPIAADTTDAEIERLANQSADWILEQADDTADDIAAGAAAPEPWPDPRDVELRENRAAVIARATEWLRGERDDLTGTKPATVGELVAAVAPRVLARFHRGQNFGEDTLREWVQAEAHTAGWTNLTGYGTSGGVVTAGVIETLRSAGSIVNAGRQRIAGGEVRTYRLADK